MERRASGSRVTIDPAHEGLDIYNADIETNAITLDIWGDKYHWSEEAHPFDSMRRVIEGVYAKDPDKEAKRDALEAMQKILWIPAGRIQAGAGTQNIVTLLNCFVDRDIEDSMTGIADALKDAMLTMQQGGGIGMNFSTLRPKHAFLSRTGPGADASGPLPFMDMWDSMCQTIQSAGKRRGAMMATMDCEHPDLIDFIVAKQTKGRLTNFNLSVLITDAFLDAVKHDEDWFLGFTEPRADKKHLFVTERETDDGIELWYAYSKWRAQELWDLITKNTYEWSEPGVIFIDRINKRNNLNYCETISCTNPCGEQPLPPNGCCNLGAVNLARMVDDPFTEYAKFDFSLLRRVAAVGTRFLDNVIDVTLYPLEAQAREELAKRRIGVGITGLANALAMLGLRYGSADAIQATEAIMSNLCEAVYMTSAELALERDSFPLYDPDKWGATSPVVQGLPDDVKKAIEACGIRNGTLLTIAPTGTTSLYAGNVSSGLEPVFQNMAQRNVRQGDDTLKPYIVYDYGYQLYKHVRGEDPSILTGFSNFNLVEHSDLTINEHLQMQAICQKYVDSSVSKTINCAPDTTLEDFQNIYADAYELGCKGCSTYRYSEVRGSILSSLPAKDAGDGQHTTAEAIIQRPDVLPGQTYKVRWPNADENYYITINSIAGNPFEVFITSTSSKYAEWTTALSLMISAIMRKGGDISFIPEELAKVRSTDDSGFVGEKYYGSLVALLGDTIGTHLTNSDIRASQRDVDSGKANPQITISAHAPALGEICPQCNQPSVIRQEGCDRCLNCNYNRCG